MSKFQAKKGNWADDDDEGDYETKPDENGVKQRVRTSTNAKGQKVRSTMTVCVKEVKVRTAKRVTARTNLAKFGEAEEGEVNVTLPSNVFVAMEHPDDQLLEENEDPALGNTLANFILRQQERAFEREHELDLMNIPDEAPAADAGPGGAKYVPPGARAGGAAGGARTLENAFGGSSGPERDTDNTLRVANLSKAATEADVFDLFSRIGRVLRVSLPRIERKDFYGNMVKEPRGFAYVAYVHKEDAARALETLQGYGYDHLILKLEWAKPPSKEGGGGGGENAHRSGYGTALAQDTKEKVSYASNLTANR